jgi:hypothetical protein
MTDRQNRRDPDPDDPSGRTPAPDHPATRDDLETTMTTQHPDDPSTDRPDPTLSSRLGWPDATSPVPQRAADDTTALPQAGTTALPQADTTALPQDDTTALPQADTTPLPQASRSGGPAELAAASGSPFRVEPSAPVPDDAVRGDGPDLSQLPPPAWAPAGEPVDQAYEGPLGPGVTVRRGPRPGTVMFGLLAIIVAGYVLVANLTDADLSLRLVGPPLIGAFGGMLLLVGLAGVVAGRLRR